LWEKLNLQKTSGKKLRKTDGDGGVFVRGYRKQGQFDGGGPVVVGPRTNTEKSERTNNPTAGGGPLPGGGGGQR